MSKIDKAKEYIGILKVYMGILTALIIGDVSGTVPRSNPNKLLKKPAKIAPKKRRSHAGRFTPNIQRRDTRTSKR